MQTFIVPRGWTLLTSVFLCFPIAPPWGWHLWFSLKCFKSYWLDLHFILNYVTCTFIVSVVCRKLKRKMSSWRLGCCRTNVSVSVFQKWFWMIHFYGSCLAKFRSLELKMVRERLWSLKENCYTISQTINHPTSTQQTINLMELKTSRHNCCRLLFTLGKNYGKVHVEVLCTWVPACSLKNDFIMFPPDHICFWRFTNTFLIKVYEGFGIFLHFYFSFKPNPDV